MIEANYFDCAVGATLLQKYDDRYHPVEYYSNILIPAELDYAPYDRELLAIFKSTCKWPLYIDSSLVTIWTNHKPLTIIWTLPYLLQWLIRWLEQLSELPLRMVYRAGKELVVSDILSRCPSQQYFLALEYIAKVSLFVRKYAPLFIVSLVSTLVVAVLSSRKSLAYLSCLHYCIAHLNTHFLSDDRTCGNCGNSWKESRHVWGNPLGVFAMLLKGKQLVSGDALFPALASLIVEPSFLALVSTGLSNYFDEEMACLCARGHSTDATFILRLAGGFSLLYHLDLNGALQLVVSGSRGLCKLLMNELYCSAISTHLGARKTIWSQYLHIWWPCLALHITVFVRSYDTCQSIKGRIAAPIGLLAPLPIPGSKLEQLTMDFVGPLPVC